MHRLLPLVVAVVALAGCSLFAEADPAVTTVPGPTTTSTVPGAATTLAQVEALVPVTEELRGLEFLDAPNIVVVTPAELETRVRALVDEELEADELVRDQATMELLGILDPGTALDELYLDLYGEQVGGYYDPETKELVVPASSTELAVKDRVVIVHELVHALTDQHFDHGPVAIDLLDADRFDEHTALLSVLEGDAVRIEGEYVQTMSSDEITDLIAEYEAIDTSVFDAAPHFIQESLIWSYLVGFEFVSDVGGTNESTDRLYEEPPTTTEQVADAERFHAREDAIPVSIGTIVPDGYEVGEESTWGYAALEALLGAVVDPATLDAAVEGWGGDRYRILFDGTNAVFELHYVADDPLDLGELATAFEEYFVDRIDEGDAWRLRTDGTTLVVLAGDEPAAVNAIVDDLGFDTIDTLPVPTTTTTTEG